MHIKSILQYNYAMVLQLKQEVADLETNIQTLSEYREELKALQLKLIEQLSWENYTTTFGKNCTLIWYQTDKLIFSIEGMLL